MSKQASPAKIGGFVVGAIGLVVLAILVVSDNKFLIHKDRFVIYFEGTINGLKVGAPVKLKGVQVGQVTDVRVELNLDEVVVRTPVFIEVNLNSVRFENSEDKDTVSDLTYELLVHHGLRAKLKSQSLLTGRLYVEINFFPKTPIRLVGNNVDVQEIPALPSDTEELINDIGIIITKLKTLPLNELFGSLLVTARNLEKFANSPELVKNAQKLEQILSSLKLLTEKMNSEFSPLIVGMEHTLSDTRSLVNNVNNQIVPLSKSAQEALLQANRSLAALEEVAGAGSPVRVDFSETLGDLSEAARSIRILADYLQRNPSALIYGKQQYEQK